MKKNIEHKHFAFTLAEVLVTMIIISVITLATTWAVNKKIRVKKKIATPHGMFACARLGNSYRQYSANGAVSLASLPAVESWDSVQSCDFTNLTVPAEAENLDVILISGGGGGGEAASVTTNYSFNRRIENTALNSGAQATITVEKTGLYELTVQGEKPSGHSTLGPYISDYNICSPTVDPTAYPGSAIKYTVDIELEQGDKIEAKKVMISSVSNDFYLPKSDDMCGGNLVAHRHDHSDFIDEIEQAIQINKISKSSSSSTLVAIVYPATPGYFNNAETTIYCYTPGSGTCPGPSSTVCNPGQISIEIPKCVGKTGNNGYVGNSTGGNSSPVYSGSPSVQLSWIGDNNNGNGGSTTQRYYGCGGEAGKTLSSSYPVAVKDFELPNASEIHIGAGGTAAAAGESTRFGALVADGGRAGGNSGNSFGFCTKSETAADADGAPGAGNTYFSSNATGGAGGTSAKNNGSDASSTGSGGGGGGYHGNALGTGGKGQGGAIILSW